MYRIIGADGKEYGPISADQLRQWIKEERANGETQAIAEGATDWKPLGSFPEFADLFQTAPASAGAPTPVFSPPAAPPRIHGLAIASLVMGILSIMSCCCYGLPFNVIGIVLSLVALSQIKQNPQLYEGRGLAIAGLVLSLVSVVLAFLWFAFSLAMNMRGVPPGIKRL